MGRRAYQNNGFSGDRGFIDTSSRSHRSCVCCLDPNVPSRSRSAYTVKHLVWCTYCVRSGAHRAAKMVASAHQENPVGVGSEKRTAASDGRSGHHFFGRPLRVHGGSGSLAAQALAEPDQMVHLEENGIDEALIGVHDNDPRRSRTQPEARLEGRDAREAGEGAVPSRRASTPRNPTKVRCQRSSRGAGDADRRVRQRCPAFAQAFLNRGCCACQRTQKRTVASA